MLPSRLTRKQSPQWMQLRADVPTFVASAAVYLASVCVIVAVLGVAGTSDTSPMTQPLFWILAAPLTVWALALVNYGRLAVRILRILMCLDAPAALMVLGLASVRGTAEITLFAAAAIVTVALTGIAFWAYSRSALRKFGPMA